MVSCHFHLSKFKKDRSISKTRRRRITFHSRLLLFSRANNNGWMELFKEIKYTECFCLVIDIEAKFDKQIFALCIKTIYFFCFS